MAKIKFNLGNEEFGKQVNYVTSWVITVICYILCIALIVDKKFVTCVPLFAFTVLNTPILKSKIRINEIVLTIIKAMLIVLTFYSIKIYI
jgi:hypothetical protein